MKQEVKHTIIVDDIHTTDLGNLSLKTGFYKNNINLLKIATHLKSVLTKNETQNYFSKKELRLPNSWYCTLSVDPYNSRKDNRNELLYNTFKQDNLNMSFLTDGVLVPALIEKISLDSIKSVREYYFCRDNLQDLYALKYYYSRKDIQTLCDYLYAIIHESQSYIKREIDYYSLKLKDLKKLLID